MKLSIRTVDLTLKEPFTVSRGTYQTHQAIVLALSDGHRTGFGEATGFPSYGAHVPAMLERLAQVHAAVEAYDLEDPTTMWNYFEPALKSQPFIQCALDVAAHDLWARQRDAPLHQLWGLDVQHTPTSSISIGLSDVATMAAKAEALADWPALKVKLGGNNDLEVVRAIRDRTSVPLRVDANCGWTPKETIGKSGLLKTLNVELIEQPLPRDAWLAMCDVHAESPLPIFADESCSNEQDLERCASCFSGVNIKLMKCGGFTPARRMIRRCRSLGLKVMLGCMPESSIGASAIAQLAPSVDYLDMDSILFLANDIARGATLDCGKVALPRGPGLGVELQLMGML